MAKREIDLTDIDAAKLKTIQDAIDSLKIAEPIDVGGVIVKK